MVRLRDRIKDYQRLEFQSSKLAMGIRFASPAPCGYCIMVVFVFWGHEASVRFTLPALKTDIKEVSKKKRRKRYVTIKFN